MSKASRLTLTAIATVAAALTILAVASPVRAADGPFSFFSLSPCRVVDTRGATGATGGPVLGANITRSFPILGACGVPLSARAVVFNITAVRPSDAGDLRMFPAGTTMPSASVINFAAGDSAVANGAIIPVADSGGNHVTVRTDMAAGSTGTVHLILDVTGYFE